MNVPHLSRHVDRFVERNVFLHALLGVVRVGERFEAYAAELVRGVTPLPLAEARAAPRSVYVLLGAIRLATRAGAVLEGFARAGAAVKTREASAMLPRFPVPRRVLR